MPGYEGDIGTVFQKGWEDWTGLLQRFYRERRERDRGRREKQHRSHCAERRAGASHHDGCNSVPATEARRCLALRHDSCTTHMHALRTRCSSMSTPIMLRQPKRVANASVTSPSLHPTSRQRRLANQLRSKH